MPHDVTFSGCSGIQFCMAVNEETSLKTAMGSVKTNINRKRQKMAISVTTLYLFHAYPRCVYQKHPVMYLVYTMINME